ncbi:hypothetical protein PAAG_01604 [Paracoccidioides lutzii Pb01]|uniref:Calcineurin-like phosphoesterase domain-containing protein n=1 Tax=Paracoccidioides lutzii (strain ATCC MYA-826 / Pb01) TaxID=502779 RepID=C1GSV9_PARBA|nr:hypothetical protein PAAG_01604 [Paracoccidioides lutzii Pb01]EEH39142.1 hypothetical protein PAAG_01604 [Paracoccidioides lutzii Pb01]
MGPYDPPPLLIRLLSSPLLFLLRPLHTLLLLLRVPPRTRTPSQRPIRVVCISDTHDRRLDSVPDGDLLLHAGDMTNRGTRRDIQATVDWLKTLPHAKKVVVAGNHDGWLDKGVRGRIELSEGDGEAGQDKGCIDWGDIHYLQNSTVTLTFTTPAAAAAAAAAASNCLSTASKSQCQSQCRTLTIHGAPQVPQLDPSPHSIHAFQYPPSPPADNNTPSTYPYPYPTPVPQATDILLTHSPPSQHLDNYPYSVGCPYLLRTVWSVRPILHVFGHAHVGRGVERVYYDKAQEAWEALCAAREERGVLWEKGMRGVVWWVFVKGGWWRDLLGLDGVWGLAGRVIWEGVKAVIWGKVWRGESGLGREGWMVNAACLDARGERLRGATVIEI